MIRFSHSANSWQVAVGSHGWFNIPIESARAYYDMGAQLWHQSTLIVI